MDAVNISANVVEAMCIRMAKERFPGIDVSCHAEMETKGLHISLFLRTNGSAAQLAPLRKEVSENVQAYTGMRVLSVLTKMEA